MKHFLLSLSLGLSLAALPSAASADTLQLQSTGGTVVNGVYIYPYNFSVNGSSNLTSLLCLDYNREVTVGETWNVSANSLAMDSSQTSIDYRALAVIDYAISTGGQGYSIADLQFADWSIFDPNDMTNNSGYTQNAQSAATQALAYANSPTLMNTRFFSSFTLYTPTSDQTGWTNGIPQEFLAYNGGAAPQALPATLPTPEPSSLALLGTGALSIGGLIRRKLKRS